LCRGRGTATETLPERSLDVLQVTLPWTDGNMLATITRGPVAIISGEHDCAAQVVGDGNAVEPVNADNGLFVIPEVYLNDVLARYLLLESKGLAFRPS
jgi:hypothetical protein